MDQNSRFEQILRLLHRLTQVGIAELASRLKVSEVTIRKDLTTLEEMGKVVRHRGGARLAQDRRTLVSLDDRLNERSDVKSALGGAARALLRDGETVFIDAGSTCALFASTLTDLSLRVVTNSILVMNAVAPAPGITLVTLGGNFRKESDSFLGPMTLENLSHLQIDTCVLGTTGLDDRGVLSCQNILEAQVKKAALDASSRRIVLADSSKFGRAAFGIFARRGDYDVLITDSEFPAVEGYAEFGGRGHYRPRPCLKLPEHIPIVDAMNIQELLDERDIDIDDIRYYLSTVLAQELLSYRDEPKELARLIWSGNLAARLYDMEERFVRELQEQLAEGVTDEAKVEELLSEIDTVCSQRNR